MKPIGKQTLLTALVIILAVLNLGLVTFMWFNQHRGPAEGPSTSRFLIKELDLDKTQEQQYIELQHRLSDSLRPVHERERQIHDRFFEMMHAANPDSAMLASTIDSMGHMRAQIEYFTFQHFRLVRALCNIEQQKKFDNIIGEAMRKMGPRPPAGNGPPPPGGPRPD